jgi:hypothetical protein
MSSRARAHSLRTRFAAANRTRPIGILAAGAILAFALAGCRPSKTPSGTSSSKTDAKSSAAATAAGDSRCQQLLSSGLDMMKPESLGVTAMEQQVVDALNNWAGECGKSAATDPAPTKSGDAYSDLYDVADIEHVRDCWLIKQLGSGVAKSQASDLERAVGLFELCVRNVALLSSEEPVIPQSPYDTMIIGRGTPEDRAWLFGSLLRQAGIDSVIVRPKVSSPSAPAANSGTTGAAQPASGSAPRWLVGVLLDKQVYLFDPTLGWPIPSPDDKGITPTVRQPATLAQVVAHDELLRKLDLADKKYPLRAADLKSVRAEIITSNRYSEPRIKRLESLLAGNRSVSVYAPLDDAGGKPGLRSRVVTASADGWKKDDVGVWDYPDRQIAAAHHLDPTAKTIHEALWLPFQGPVELDFDVKALTWKVVQGNTIKTMKGKGGGRQSGDAPPGQGDDKERVEVRIDARKQIKARIAQLQADYATAVRKYLNVQLEELPKELPLPDEIQERAKSLPPDKRPKGLLKWKVPDRERAINGRGAEDAKFWMGVCQMEQNEPGPAEETFQSYLRRYGQGGGTWVVQAAFLRGLLLAENKKPALAVQAITQLAQALPENDFRRPTYQLLEVRWRAARDAAKASPSGTDSTQGKSASAAPKTEQSGAKPTTPEKAAASAPTAAKAPTSTPAPPQVKPADKTKTP